MSLSSTMGPATTMASSIAPTRPYRQDLSTTLICRDCQEIPPNIIEEASSGDVVCASCGLVLSARLVDTRSEWRTFANDDQGNDDPSRVGDAANPLLNGSQLETTISFGDGGSGRSRDLHRAQNKSNHDKSTKSLLAAYKEIGAFCDSIHILRETSDVAKRLFKMVDDAKAFKAKPQQAVLAGCIFIACRQSGHPRTFQEIYDLTSVPKKEIGRIFKQLEKFFITTSQKKQEAVAESGGLVYKSPEDYATSQTTNPLELCGRFCSQLGLPRPAHNLSKSIAERMGKLGVLAGRSPLSAAAACIYMASHIVRVPKTAKDISSVAGVSDGTIRTAYKILYEHRDELVDQAWIADGKGDMKLLPPS